MNNSENSKELFKSHIDAEKVTATRSMCLLGSLLYLIFMGVDMLSFSYTPFEVLIIRGSVVAFLLISALISYTSYIQIFIKYYDFLFSVFFLVATAGIEAMIYLAQPEDHAYYVYFAGLLLIIMTIFSWSYFKFPVSAVLTILVISSYSYIEYLKGMNPAAILVNDVFLVSSAIISFAAQLIRDRYIRENFLLQQSLKEAIKEKTLEAKDNAYLANHDSLTNLSNRRHVTELLEGSLQIAKEKDQVLALLFIDLNDFKKVNDEYGHAVGDAVLVIVARRLELAIREGDHLARLGGDEYLVSLMMDKSSLAEVKKIARKFSDIISKSMIVDGAKITIGVSIGISAYPMHGNKISVLLDIADKKMYRVKQGLKNIPCDRKDQYRTSVVELPRKSKQAW